MRVDGVVAVGKNTHNVELGAHHSKPTKRVNMKQENYANFCGFIV